MRVFTEVESLIILCFYKYDKAKNIKKFVDLFNQYFNRDISEQTILYEISIIRSAEASANMAATDERVYYRTLWQKYSNGSHLANLRQLYSEFKSGRFIESFPENDIEVYKIDPQIIIEDTPIIAAELITKGAKEIEKRRKSIVAYALSAAGYQCECDCNNMLFLRKDETTPYTEGHHLIPLHFQRDFTYSVDISANVVSLCPSCHKKLHFGANTEEMLFMLFEKRKERLEKCGIHIDFTDLLLMYR